MTTLTGTLSLPDGTVAANKEILLIFHKEDRSVGLPGDLVPRVETTTNGVGALSVDLEPTPTGTFYNMLVYITDTQTTKMKLSIPDQVSVDLVDAIVL